MSKISAETADRIKQSTDIVEVIGDFVSLKKRGANYIACCPFHNEKTPSFNVNPVRQIYKCFGCGQGGDAIKFVMDVEGIGYAESLKYLANKYQIEIEEEQHTPEEVTRQNERESLYIALNFAQKYFNKILTEHPDGQGIGLSYFHSRNLSNPTIQQFGLGYSLDQWDGFYKEAIKKGYQPEILEKAGLITQKLEENKVYDRFRGRVMFPIHNVSGKVIAFGARILVNDKSQAKYLNSPETDVYHKSKNLYGIYHAKNAIRQADSCYLVEGYLDVISLHQAGFQNVVASSGTSLTEDQIRLIARFTQNITILYDGDAAGIKAALRGLDLVLEQGLNVSIVVFPEGQDPDSFVYQVGAEGFKAYLSQNSTDFITFKAKMLLKDAGNDPFKRANAITEIVESISKIPDPIKRQVFTSQTATLMKVDEQTLISEGNRLLRKSGEEKQKEASRERSQPKNNAFQPEIPDDLFLSVDENDFIPPEVPTQKPVTLPTSKVFTHEQECIRLLISYATHELEPNISLCHYILSEIEDLEFETPIFNHILQSFKTHFKEGKVLNTQYFIDHLDPEIQQLSITFVSDKYELSENWLKHEIIVKTEIDILADAAYSNILRLKKSVAEKRMTELLSEIRNAVNDDEIFELQKQFMHFKNVDKQIAGLLGNVVSR